MSGVKHRPKSLRASDIRTAMSKTWAGPEWAIMWEVNEATGAGRGRSADAVMMSLWPSRGLELHGVEIKVSRSDWKREAADPTKAEAVAKFCDRWWIHTSPGVVHDVSEVPPMWGLREWDGARWTTRREAQRRENVPDPSRSFLAALLRRADNIVTDMIRESTAEIRALSENEARKIREKYNDDVRRGVELRMRSSALIEAKLTAFEDAFGGKIDDYKFDLKTLGFAARALHDVGRRGLSMPSPVKLREAADQIERIESIVNAPSLDKDGSKPTRANMPKGRR